MRYKDQAIAFLGAAATPAGLFAVLALAFELLVPGAVSRWADMRAIVLPPAAVWFAWVALSGAREPERAKPWAYAGSALAIVALAAAVTVSAAGPGPRFLLFTVLATVFVTYSVLRDAQE